jgi:urease accessory protein
MAEARGSGAVAAVPERAGRCISGPLTLSLSPLGRGDDGAPAVIAPSSAPAENPSGYPLGSPRPLAEVAPDTLRKLLTWLSPAFPVGSYSYSHGLEWAIEDGSVHDRATLTAWLADVLTHGAGHNDAILFLEAWRAADAGDAQRLRAVAELGAAFQPSRERHLEATAQGRAFLAAVLAAWPCQRLAAVAAVLPAEDPLPYPVAVALCAAAHGIPPEPALGAMLHGFVANIVSAGVRAIPVGQTDGLKVVAALGAVIDATIAAAAAAGLDDLGGAALRADIASMRHETQYTRLFRS